MGAPFHSFQIFVYCESSVLGDFKRFTGRPVLSWRIIAAISCVAIRSNIFDFEADNVTCTQFAIDGNVK